MIPLICGYIHRLARRSSFFLLFITIAATLYGHAVLVKSTPKADEKVKVYDKGVEVKSGEELYQTLVSYRTGDMWAPKVEQIEALKAEASYFVDCILNNQKPFNDGEAGLRVVKMLQAADESLRKKGG